MEKSIGLSANGDSLTQTANLLSSHFSALKLNVHCIRIQKSKPIMKNFFLSRFTLLLIVCICSLQGYTQGIYQLWGTTSYGGTDDRGVLFSTKYDGTAQAVKKNFAMENPGKPNLFNVPVLCNGKLYTLMEKGGISEDAIITEYDPVTNTYTQRADLLTLDVPYSETALTSFNNKLYSVSYYGGQHSGGFIYEFNPANNALTKVYDFDTLIGGNPSGELLVYNNKLYGTTRKGGNQNEGILYEYDPVTDLFAVKAHITPSTTGIRGNLTVYSNRFYGIGDGIYSYNTITNAIVKHADFDSINLHHSYGTLTLLNNKLYGVANEGGANEVGGIYEFNPATNVLVSKLDFNAFTAQRRCDLLAYNNKLYSASYFSDTIYDGMIFSYDPATDLYQNKVFFNNTTGRNGAGRLMLYNNKMYGFTSYGAAYGEGSLFEYNPVNNAYVKKVDLGGTDLYNPSGQLLYYNNKIYGTASKGGNNGDGGIYEYDPRTQTFTIKVQMTELNGRCGDQGGFTLYNGKFYGVTMYGGINGEGALYEYDPATNTYTKRHDFLESTGHHPTGRLVEAGGKLYGTALGSTNDLGNIYEYNPVTHAYAQKVILSASMGSYPYAGLTAYNGKLYGVTHSGGNNGDGVLFEYNPVPNSYLVKAHFNDQTTGLEAQGNLVVYNNKLYGVTGSIYSADGVIYEFDPANDALVHKYTLTTAGGKYVLGGMMVLNNKLYGMTSIGGTVPWCGTLFEYNPTVNSYTPKTFFEGLNGRLARRSELVSIPAPVAPGNPGSCTNSQTININAANANEWIAFTDNQGRAVAEINANGNIMGNTTVRYFINGGNMRMDANGTFYLDRNITITATNQPVTPVSIRLYIQKSELESIQATQGSGVVIPSDLVIYRNNDFCASSLATALTQLYTTQSNWSVDYVYATETSVLGSFYFAAGNNISLPIQLISFTGKKHKDHNELNWQATCNNNARFDLERSEDGLSFKTITSITASAQDCEAPFGYKDDQFAEGNNYYRLLLNDNGNTTYSNIVLLQREGLLDTELKIVPNPVTHSAAHIYIRSSRQKTIHLTITDITGKIMKVMEIPAGQGVSQYPVDMSDIASGIYYAQYYDGGKMHALKFVKQ
jgi:uncharacterized repeat protein (TIGR03803 family)